MPRQRRSPSDYDDQGRFVEEDDRYVDIRRTRNGRTVEEDEIYVHDVHRDNRRDDRRPAPSRHDYDYAEPGPVNTRAATALRTDASVYGSRRDGPPLSRVDDEEHLYRRPYDERPPQAYHDTRDRGRDRHDDWLEIDDRRIKEQKYDRQGRRYIEVDDQHIEQYHHGDHDRRGSGRSYVDAAPEREDDRYVQVEVDHRRDRGGERDYIEVDDRRRSYDQRVYAEPRPREDVEVVVTRRDDRGSPDDAYRRDRDDHRPQRVRSDRGPAVEQEELVIRRRPRSPVASARPSAGNADQQSEIIVVEEAQDRRSSRRHSSPPRSARSRKEELQEVIEIQTEEKEPDTQYRAYASTRDVYDHDRRGSKPALQNIELTVNRDRGASTNVDLQEVQAQDSGMSPIVRPPIVQEIIHHHRHINHAVEYERNARRLASIVGPPSEIEVTAPSSSRKRSGGLEVEIHRSKRQGDNVISEDLEIDAGAVVPANTSLQVTRVRSTKPAKSSRQASSVKSKVSSKSGQKMWTELAKDIVVKEALEISQYDFEENDEFFYVKEVLQYADVLQLAKLSESIRRARREEINSVAWDKEDSERMSVALSTVKPRFKERIYKRDTTFYDTRRKQ